MALLAIDKDLLVLTASQGVGVSVSLFLVYWLARQNSKMNDKLLHMLCTCQQTLVEYIRSVESRETAEVLHDNVNTTENDTH